MKRNAEIRLQLLHMAYQIEQDAYHAVCADLNPGLGQATEETLKPTAEFLPVVEEIVATAEVLADFVFADEEGCCELENCDFGEIIENEED